MALDVVPVTFADACAFVSAWHRHHEPPVGHKFSIGGNEGNAATSGVKFLRNVWMVIDTERLLAL